jgi:hypothetical protein
MRLTAIQLKAGDRVLSCPNHPTLRGTIQAVNFYNRPQAVIEATGKPDHRPAPNWKGATILAHDTVGKVLSVKAPPSAKTARTSAKAVEECYREGQEERVSVRVAGYPSVTLNPTDVVDVWVPDTEAA